MNIVQPCAFNVKPVAFPDLLPEIRHFYRAIARRKGLEFAVEIDADVPPAIATDRLRLQQLLSSLLARAFEVTREGGVVLRIRRSGGGTPETTVIAFDIVCAGIMPKRRCAGLQILRRAVAVLEGYLALAWTPGEGSVISLYLPLVAAGVCPKFPAPDVCAARSSFPPAVSPSHPPPAAPAAP